MKKYLCLLILSFLAIFVFVGCGEEKNDPKPVDPPVVDPSDPTNPTDPVDPEPTEEIDISKVKFYDGVYSYDGAPKSLSINPMSIPKGVSVEYEGNGQTEIGKYTVKAILKDSKGNVLGELTATLTINKEKKNVSKVKFESATYEWEKGKTYEILATNVPNGVKVEYENNKLTDIGKAEATAKLYDEYDNELLATLTATLVVKYRAVNDEEAFTSLDKVYDGATYTITLSDETKFAKVEYENNSASECGTYLAKALVTTTDGDKFEYRAILNIEHPFNQEFRDYTDEMFVYFLEGDQMTLNIFMIDYEAYGFEHQEATWSSYKKYTDEDHQNDLEEIARLKEEFAKFDRAALNSYQKVDYDKIKQELDFLDFMITNPEYILMRQTYIDRFGGYAGDIPSSMEAYQVRTKQDIEDIISYIDSVDEAFATYVDYILDRAEAGYPLTNFTLNNMIDYLDGVSKRKAKEDDEDKDTPYYLIAILEKKITDSKDLLGLTDGEVTAYVERLDNAFVDFIQAHIDLATAIEERCMNKATDELSHYLASYGEKGKILYEQLLRNRLGITMPLEDYIAFLDETISKYYTAYTGYSSNSTVNSIVNGEVKVLNTDDPDEIIEFLRNEFAKAIVKDLQNSPTIDIAYMDKTVTANTTTVAYYMKSALDSTDKEFIHLNGDVLGNDYLETIKTLAHEGYPGHLYAYVNTKENPNLSNYVRVSTNTGHGEGWAKYVECALCDYLAQLKKGDWVNAMGKSKYWDLFIYQIYTRIDIGISYQGWDVKEVLKFLKNQNLSVTEDSARDILLDLIEMPGQYAAYGYGQALFYEMHTEAKELLKDSYNEVEFNEMLLSHGWIGLSDLQELYNDYMTQKCFLNNVEFNK